MDDAMGSSDSVEEGVWNMTNLDSLLCGFGGISRLSCSE